MENEEGYLNARCLPSVGDVWIYHDEKNEGDVEWEIQAINTKEGTCSLKKLTGLEGREYQHPEYSLSEIVDNPNKRWRVKSGGIVNDVLWNCPHCEGARPIAIGDYVCQDCRAKLDRTEATV